MQFVTQIPTQCYIYGDEVDIDEDDIRDYYDRSRITRDLVSELSDDFHNEWIEYYEDEDGDYCPDGELSDYFNNKHISL
jgi:hypothetical protein